MNSEQIAKLAGVSRSTVSKVLHNYPDISEETRRKVMKVVNDSDYRPNTMAQALKGITPKVVSVYIYAACSNAQEQSSEFSSNYNLSLLSQLALESRSRGYAMTLDFIREQEPPERIVSQVEEAFRSRRTGAAVFVGLNENCSFINEIIESETRHHVIVLDREVRTGGGARCIMANDRAGAACACRFLMEQGYGRVMHVSGDLRKLSAAERRNGYLDAMRDAGCEPFIMSGNFSYQSGYECADAFLRNELFRRFDGVVFACDLMGHGFIDRISETHAVLLPRIGMIGFDNDPIDMYKKPNLSTMAMDFGNLARIIMNLEESYEQFSGGITMKIDHLLIKRESTRPKEERIRLFEERSVAQLRAEDL